MNLQHEVKVGIFLLLSISALIFSILWLNNFEIASTMHIYAKFKDAGPLGEGTRVIYRGVDVGKVKEINLSQDGQYAMLDISVNNKKIRFPKMSTATIIDKGFTGTKVVAIVPPEKLDSNGFLLNNDIIEGKKSFTFEELQKLLAKKSEDGAIENIIDNADLLLKNSTKLTHQLDQVFLKLDNFTSKKNVTKLNLLVNNIITLSENMNKTSRLLNNLLTDNTVAKDLKTTMTSAQTAFTSLNTITNKTGKFLDSSKDTVSNFNSVLQNTDKTLNSSKGSLKDSLEKMSDILIDIKSITGDDNIKQNFKSLIQNTDNAFIKVNCVSSELSKSLSKGFLIPRMLFGNPGKNLGKCVSN